MAMMPELSLVGKVSQMVNSKVRNDKINRCANDAMVETAITMQGVKSP